MLTVTATKHTHIPDEDIIYFITRKGIVEIGLVNQEPMFSRLAIKDLALKYPDFISTGNKCLVRPSQIDSICPRTLYIKNTDTTLPISRGYKNKIKETLNDLNMDVQPCTN